MPEIFLAWKDTQKFVREVRQTVTDAVQTKDEQKLSFATLVKTAETVGEKFGKFQDAECAGLKAALVQKEDRGTGRVRLSDFYKPAAKGATNSWQFEESVGYLRSVGALDESNSDEPRVMIANYLISQANCIASSDYYSVCCINECEDLFSHLEKSIAAPSATAAKIVELVSSLSSASVSAPRTLSATLRSRLDEIAAAHGGSVQLHSRLFTQWMHHAYPRECPYPHVSGTTSQESAETWTDGNGGNATATEEELMQFTSNTIDISPTETVEDIHDLMMWTHDEELLIVRPALVPVAKSSGWITVLRNVVLFAALASVMLGLVHSVKGPACERDASQKFMV
jgi:hypothetical protein